MKDLEKLSVEELAKLISPNSDVRKELKKRGVTRTNNVIGELGEYYIVQYYKKNPDQTNLSLAATGGKNADALSRKGERYSIKTITGTNKTTGSFWDRDSIINNEKTFEYLVICILDNDYSLKMILELTWDDFFKYKKFNKRMDNFQISVTQKLIREVKVVYKNS